MVESERADCVIIGVRIYYNKVKSIMSMFKNISNTVYLSIILAISPMSSAGPIPGLDTNIDQASYDLGEVVAFSEMVGVGVKKTRIEPGDVTCRHGQNGKRYQAHSSGFRCGGLS